MRTNNQPPKKAEAETDVSTQQPSQKPDSSGASPALAMALAHAAPETATPAVAIPTKSANNNPQNRQGSSSHDYKSTPDAPRSSGSNSRSKIMDLIPIARESLDQDVENYNQLETFPRQKNSFRASRKVTSLPQPLQIAANPRNKAKQIPRANSYANLFSQKQQPPRGRYHPDMCASSNH